MKMDTSAVFMQNLGCLCEGWGSVDSEPGILVALVYIIYLSMRA